MPEYTGPQVEGFTPVHMVRQTGADVWILVPEYDAAVAAADGQWTLVYSPIDLMRD